MPRETRSVRGLYNDDPGPYEAIIVNHLDPKFSGALQVELLKGSVAGNQPERTGQLVTVKYLSPFYGVTPINGNSKNDTYQNTQQAYGFWSVPPDVGTRVLVIFAEGNISRGYWIGCIQDQFMNHTIPDPRVSSKYNNEDTNINLPTGEFNKKVEDSITGNIPNRYIKPVNTDWKSSLTTQGLLEDTFRGLTSTSARREVPSAVYGLSTPGPQDKRPNAPTAPAGPYGARSNNYSARLGGSSIVFDDGNDLFLRKGTASEAGPEYADVVSGDTDGKPTLLHNELVRLRTRTGHQILMHNTEDLIYIGNARGTSWIELSSDGKIDIFSEDSISIHTENDLNIKADRDINMEAGRNVNIKATAEYQSLDSLHNPKKIIDANEYENGRVQIESAFNTNILIGANGRIETRKYINAQDEEIDGSFDVNVKGNTRISTGTGSVLESYNLEIYTEGNTLVKQTGNLDINTGQRTSLTAGATTEILSGGDHIETASNIHMNGPDAREADLAIVSNTIIDLSVFDTPYVNTALEWNDTKYQDENIASIMKRVPMHEPWSNHENLSPLTVKPAETDREKPKE